MNSTLFLSFFKNVCKKGYYHRLNTHRILSWRFKVEQSFNCSSKKQLEEVLTSLMEQIDMTCRNEKLHGLY